MTTELELWLEIAAAAGALESGQTPDYLAAGDEAGVLALAAQHVNSYAPRVAANRWTAEEEKFLRDNLGTLSPEEIARQLGRSPTAVKIRWTRKGYPAPSKRPGYLTGQQVANALGVDVHQVMYWTDSGMLRSRRVPGNRVIRAIKYTDLVRWVVNPRNWVYFENSVFEVTRSAAVIRKRPRGTSRITNLHLRRLIELRKERWGDAWWSTGQVAEYHGVGNNWVEHLVVKGLIPAYALARHNNWRILRSYAAQMTFSHGRGAWSPVRWTDKADAFLVLGRAVGLTPTVMAHLCGWLEQRVSYRLKLLHEGGLIPDLITRHGLKVQYDPATGRLFANWRDYTGRFPGLAKAAGRFAAGEMLSRLDRQYVRGILWAWAGWYAGAGDEAQQRVVHGLTYSGPLTAASLLERYKLLSSWGIAPFDCVQERRKVVARKRQNKFPGLRRGVTPEMVKEWYKEWYAGEGRSATWIGENNGVVKVGGNTISSWFKNLNLPVDRDLLVRQQAEVNGNGQVLGQVTHPVATGMPEILTMDWTGKNGVFYESPAAREVRNLAAELLNLGATVHVEFQVQVHIVLNPAVEP